MLRSQADSCRLGRWARGRPRARRWVRRGKGGAEGLGGRGGRWVPGSGPMVRSTAEGERDSSHSALAGLSCGWLRGRPEAVRGKPPEPPRSWHNRATWPQASTRACSSLGLALEALPWRKGPPGLHLSPEGRLGTARGSRPFLSPWTWQNGPDRTQSRGSLSGTQGLTRGPSHAFPARLRAPLGAIWGQRA